MYANACSIINKFVAFEAMVCNYEPDVIGIAESWAHNGINDSEIALKGYDLFRCDRQVNVRGGGVLIYVKHGLGAVQVNVNTEFPEHVWCRLKVKGFESLLIGVCYRTPTERIYAINLHEKLRDLVRQVAEKNLVLMGDFNYRNIDWEQLCNNGGGLEAQKKVSFWSVWRIAC